MHPEEIKAGLRMRGITLAALADEAGVSRSMLSHVVNGHARSAHLMERIAGILGRPISEIWAERPVLRRVTGKAASGGRAV
ncbi:helix-turn-helix domain-containing protein [Piscinibacter sakaiensis]|uniref:helix-turn-helix domain-containing protein n=1 Tax=Piscinibacter sakaiensis TaxID=1547922 RepID=UPI0009E9573A